MSGHVPMCLWCGSREVSGKWSQPDGSGFCSFECHVESGRNLSAWNEWQAEADMAHWDNDPNPYEGTYSEE